MTVIKSFMLLYGSLSFLSLVILVHLRMIQRDYQRVSDSLETRKIHEIEGLNTEYSHTLSTLARSRSTARVPKKSFLGRLRDSPTFSTLLIAFSMVISGSVAALIIVSIMISGLDVASFIIFVSFFVYLYIQGYPHLIMYLRAVKSTEFERMTTKDLKYVKRILIKVRDLQSDLMMFIPMFLVLAFTYEGLRDSLISSFSEVAFYLNEQLFLPVFETNILLGTMFLILTMIIVLSVMLFIIIKGWSWSRRYRRKLVP